MDEHKKIMLIGGASITLLASEHPEIFKGHPDLVGVEIVSDVDCEILDIELPEKRDLLAVATDMIYPIHAYDLEDCQPALCDIDDRQSWQQMNRGGISKKQRRNRA